MSFADYIKPMQKKIESLEAFSSVKAQKRDLYLMDNEGKLSGIGHKAICLEDSNEVLYVGKEYEILQNEDIATELLRFMESTPYQVHNIRSINNRRFDVTLVNKEKSITIGNEPAYRTVVVTNSYDGSCAFSITFGVNIQVCGNGARVTKPLDGLSKKHTQNILDFSKIAEKAIILDEKVDRFNQTWNANGEISKSNFEKIASVFPKKTNGDIHDLAAELALKSHIHVTEHNYPPNFALFMAATNMTTYPSNHGMSDAYSLRMEQKITEVFFK